MFLFGQFSYAQGSFIEEISPEEVVYNDNTERLLQIIEDDPELYPDFWHVKMNDVQNHVSNLGNLTFSLPSLPEIELKPTFVDENSSHGMIWSGNASSGNAYMTFVQNSTGKAATIKYGNYSYQVVPTATDQHLLVKTKPKNDKSCAIDTATDLNSGPDYCEIDQYNTCPAIIKILFVITQDDVSNFNSLFSIGFYTGIQEGLTNMCFVNSDIPNKRVSIDYEVIASFPFNSDPALNIYDRARQDLIKLSNDPNIANLRDANNADLVFLLYNGSTYFTGFGGAVLGIASLPSGPDESEAFGIFNFTIPFEDLIFQHELGHTMSCRHNRTPNLGNDDNPVCWHGKRAFYREQFQQEGYRNSWGTIVATNIRVNEYVAVEVAEDEFEVYFIEHTEIIPHYSNPYIFYDAIATGDPDDSPFPKAANNARRIRDIGCDIAAYRGGQDFQAFITQPSPCETNWIAEIVLPSAGNPGTAPYSYEWKTSLTGLFNGQNGVVVGNLPTLSITNIPDCKFWLQCTVTSSDGITITQTQMIDLTDCDCIPFVRNTKQVEESVSTNLTILSPNPVKDILTIQFGFTGSILVELFDVHGLLVFQQKFPQSKGRNVLECSALVPGIYSVRVSDEHANTYSTKILKY